MRTKITTLGGSWPLRRRRQMFDIALAAAIAASACVTGHEYHPAGWAPFDGRAYLLSCLVALPLVWRRAAPMSALAATCAAYSLYLALGYQPTVNWWAPMIALVSLTARRSLRMAAVGAVLTCGAVLHSGLAGHLSLVMAAGQALLISLVAVFLGRTQRLFTERNHELRRLTEQLKREQQERARRAVVDERMRIARELHDVVAHHMSVITVQAGLAGYVFSSEPDTARAALDNLAGAGREALADLRRLLSVLRVDVDEDDIPDPEETTASALSRLDDLAARVRATGVDVAIRTEGRAHLPASRTGDVRVPGRTGGTDQRRQTRTRNPGGGHRHVPSGCTPHHRARRRRHRRSRRIPSRLRARLDRHARESKSLRRYAGCRCATRRGIRSPAHPADRRRATRIGNCLTAVDITGSPL
ncbi:sensor histidine kinase [Streptomyces melanogenes]|uniref:sensor histidine kinase n=1 Tax=Streptomyces melanogenes TaxID=67326 RepID=UPI004032B4BF